MSIGDYMDVCKVCKKIKHLEDRIEELENKLNCNIGCTPYLYPPYKVTCDVNLATNNTTGEYRC